MQVMLRLRSARYLAWLLVSVVAVPYLASGAMAAKRSEGIVQTVLLFPLDNPVGRANNQIVNELQAFVERGLSTYRRCRVIMYSDRLPAVQRLITMQPDKESAVGGPFATDAAAISRAAMLGRIIAADLLIIGSVDKYVFTPEKGTAELTATVEVLDGKTGRTLQTITVTGNASKPAGIKAEAESSIALRSVKDAGRQIISGITGEEYAEPQQPAKAAVVASKGGGKKSWIPLLLISLGVGLLLGGSGGSGGAGGGGTSDGGDEPPSSPF